jgi:PDZ domain-containing secreted protein
MNPKIPDGSTFLGNLSTIGRVTGKIRTVKLRFVFYNGKFYASRRNPNGDWLKNLLSNPSVIVEVDGEKIEGHAELVKDEKLSKKISELKYSDERREEKRIVVEITPKEIMKENRP